jgi:hypothetical protein
MNNSNRSASVLSDPFKDIRVVPVRDVRTDIDIVDDEENRKEKIKRQYDYVTCKVQFFVIGQRTIFSMKATKEKQTAEVDYTSKLKVTVRFGCSLAPTLLSMAYPTVFATTIASRFDSQTLIPAILLLSTCMHERP